MLRSSLRSSTERKEGRVRKLCLVQEKGDRGHEEVREVRRSWALGHPTLSPASETKLPHAGMEIQLEGAHQGLRETMLPDF